MKIKKGDNVQVIAGRDKGKSGKVIQVLPDESRVVVEGANKRFKHAKTRKQGETGQKIDFFAPMHVSNVMLVGASTEKKTRVGYKVLDDGKKVRIEKRSGNVIE